MLSTKNVSGHEYDHIIIQTLDRYSFTKWSLIHRIQHLVLS